VISHEGSRLLPSLGLSALLDSLSLIGQGLDILDGAGTKRSIEHRMVVETQGKMLVASRGDVVRHSDEGCWWKGGTSCSPGPAEDNNKKKNFV